MPKMEKKMFVTFAIDFFDKTLPQQSPLVTFVGQYLYWTYEQVQWSKKIVVLNLRKKWTINFCEYKYYYR